MHLRFDTLDVFAGAGIDLDDFAHIDKQGYTHHRTCFQRRRLAPATGGIATYTRIGFRHAQQDEIGRRNADRRPVPEGNQAGVLLLEPFDGIGNSCLAGGNLLVADSDNTSRSNGEKSKPLPCRFCRETNDILPGRWEILLK